MGVSKSLDSCFAAVTVALVLMIIPTGYSQVGSACTASMLTSFAPCVNFLTNSSATGSSPTADCCDSLKSLMSNGTGCLCKIVTGGVPFRVPINRTVAISLPKACHMSGVPVQCKASSAPVPAPGPTAFTPELSPTAAVSPSPIESTIPTTTSPALAPEANSIPALTPPSPSSATGSGISLTPSAAKPSLSFSPSLVLFPLALVIIKYY
ncbi:hypothetical protein Ancab_013321 [Ancistrocladus abbreviatus]